MANEILPVQQRWSNHFADNDGYVTAWTIVPSEISEAILSGDQIYSDLTLAEPYYVEAYAWMKGIMADCGLHKPQDGVTPWWCWIQYGGGSVKPRNHVLRSGDCVMLELRIPASDLLLSDFDLWHSVLNCCPAFLSEAEDDDFYHRLEAFGPNSKDSPYPEPFMSEVQSSWYRIFDLGIEAEYATYSLEKKGIQGVFWAMKPEYVVGIATPAPDFPGDVEDSDEE